MRVESSVDVNRMNEAAQRMDAAVRSVQSQKADVEAAVGQLASFTGSAADSYRNAMSGWYQNADTIISELEKMARTMRESAENYQRGHNDANRTADDAALYIRNASSVGLAGL
ncbi:WXG100 family type VII secretion target [Saccharopolyspora shandongensis]|uniref:WXG100 family type VII secretion target n=1 Tax=Saccharopolyspora shandongensis TaxID=418495 RepID=UPI003448BC1B